MSRITEEERPEIKKSWEEWHKGIEPFEVSYRRVERYIHKKRAL